MCVWMSELMKADDRVLAGSELVIVCYFAVIGVRGWVREIADRGATSRSRFDD
jgi:hypothetical protein